MEDCLFNPAQQIGDFLGRLVFPGVRDTDQRQLLHGSSHLKSILEDLGIVVRSGNVHDGRVIGVVSFEPGGTDNLNCGIGRVGGVGSAIGTRVNRDDVGGRVCSGYDHVFRVDQDYVTILEHAGIGHGKGEGVGG